MIVGHNPIVVDDEIWPIATPCRVRAFGPALEFEQSWVPSERLIMKEFEALDWMTTEALVSLQEQVSAQP